MRDWHRDEAFAQEAVIKWMRRSGIRRIYCFDTVRREGRLKLEFVLRGKVLGYLSLWRIKPLWEDK